MKMISFSAGARSRAASGALVQIKSNKLHTTIAVVMLVMTLVMLWIMYSKTKEMQDAKISAGSKK